MRYIQPDIFELSVIIIEDNGKERMYYIELIDGIYFLFVRIKKKKSCKWSSPRIIEKSDKPLRFDIDPSAELGVKSVIVA